MPASMTETSGGFGCPARPGDREDRPVRPTNLCLPRGLVERARDESQRQRCDPRRNRGAASVLADWLIERLPPRPTRKAAAALGVAERCETRTVQVHLSRSQRRVLQELAETREESPSVVAHRLLSDLVPPHPLDRLRTA